mgnify:FL=1
MGMPDKDKTADNLKDLVEVTVLSAIGVAPGNVTAGVINVKG